MLSLNIILSELYTIYIMINLKQNGKDNEAKYKLFTKYQFFFIPLSSTLISIHFSIYQYANLHSCKEEIVTWKETHTYTNNREDQRIRNRDPFSSQYLVILNGKVSLIEH